MNSHLSKMASLRICRGAKLQSHRSFSLLSSSSSANHANIHPNKKQPMNTMSKFMITNHSNHTQMNNNNTQLMKIMSKTHTFSTLCDLLQREIAEEAANPLNTMPTDLSELKNILSEHWTIVEGSKASSNDGATVKMYKKENLSNGSKVTLTFHCQDSLNAEELGFLDSAVHEASEAVGGNGGEEGEEEEESTPIKFDVTVSRAGKVMHLSCTSEAAEASIDGITISSSEKATENDEDLYRGPMLEDLPEDVKDALDQYLEEECGVNEDVAAFIAMYADYREQMEYINWLKDVKKIVD